MLEKFLDLVLNNFSDVMAFVSAVCSVISLITIIILLIERAEKKRP